jgi:HK97 family phage major capsid protein
MSPTALRQLALANREIETKQKAAAFADVAKYLMLGKGNLGNTLSEAQFKRANERVVEGVKAATAAGTTSSGTFAGPLSYTELADAFLSSLRNVGAFDSALPFAKQIPLNVAIALVSVGASAASIGEGQSKVISKLTLAASTLNIRKAVAILIASQELLRASGVASRLFSDELQRAVAAETDSAFLSVLTNGITLSETGLFKLFLAPRRDAVHKPSRSRATCCVLK